MIDHPSYLELDRAALRIEVASETRAHLTTCERCRHHVERLVDHDPPPVWLRELAPARAARRTWFLAGGFVLAASAALVLVLVLARPDREPAYTTVKGVPTVAVHIKRGDVVFLWDGVEPVKPGDRLRLEIVARDHRRVQVLAEDGTSLVETALPATGSLLLPAAWQVDAQPGAETLTVLLTDARGGVWRTTLTLTKQIEGLAP